MASPLGHRRLRDTDPTVIDLEAQVREEGALYVPYHLLRRRSCLHQDVHLRHLTHGVGHHSRRKHPLKAGEQLLRPFDPPRVRLERLVPRVIFPTRHTLRIAPHPMLLFRVRFRRARPPPPPPPRFRPVPLARQTPRPPPP